jgi:hypothetical protein
MMTQEQARQRVNAINSGINNLRMQILDFHDREGWKALGYDSWTACVEKEFEQGRRYIFYQLQAAQIEKNINDSAKSQCTMVHSEGEGEDNPPFPEPIPERHLRPLSALSPEDQKPAWELARETAPEGKLTAAHVEKTVKEVTDKPWREKVYKLTRPKEQKPQQLDDIVITAIAYIDLIRDDMPGAKQALAKISNHVWNRLHRVEAV